MKHWEEKLDTGLNGKHAQEPTKHMSSDLLSDNIKPYCKKQQVNKFIPRDFRRTFKTLAGQLKISNEIRDRIQHHALHDVSTVHYDRYDYNEEKMEALLKWEAKLKEIMNNS